MKPCEQKREDIQQERIDWMEWIYDVDLYRIVFIDETGFKTNFTPRYGWSLRGQPCIGEAPGGWKSYSAISAIRLGGIVETTSVEGAFNKCSFKEYMEDILLPSLKHGDIVVMDNLSIHKNSFSVEKFKRKGITIKYLPRYSPDLNPIELMWAKWKPIIRSMEPRNGNEIWQAINEAQWRVTPENISGWFRGCGYFH